MKESYRFVARTLLIAGPFLLFHDSIIGLYDWVLGSLISLFPASRLIPTGAHFSSSQWVIITLTVLLTVPGFGHKARIFMLSISLLGYLAVDFFSFLVWLVPPEASSGPGVHFTYTQVWRFFGQWTVPFLLMLIALASKFEQSQVNYIKKKSFWVQQ